MTLVLGRETAGWSKCSEPSFVLRGQLYASPSLSLATAFQRDTSTHRFYRCGIEDTPLMKESQEMIEDGLVSSKPLSLWSSDGGKGDEPEGTVPHGHSCQLPELQVNVRVSRSEPKRAHALLHPPCSQLLSSPPPRTTRRAPDGPHTLPILQAAAERPTNSRSDHSPA